MAVAVATPSTDLTGTKPLKLDPTRALEPSKKKLSAVEAQRIMSVVEDSIKKMEAVTLIRFATENLDRFNVLLGAELVEMLNHHNILQKSADELHEALKKEDDKKGEYQEGFVRPDSLPEAQAEADVDEIDIVRGTSRAESIHRNIGLINNEIAYSCRNILRAFSNSPSSLDSIRSEFLGRSTEAQTLVDYSLLLKEVLYERLLTTPNEQRDKYQYLNQITERHRLNTITISKLEADLQAAVNEKNQEIDKKNDQIRKIQLDMHTVERYSEESIKSMKQDAEKEQQATHKSHEAKCNKLQSDFAQLKMQFSSHRNDHREKESALRAKKYKVESELDNWIQKYDKEMGDRQTEYEQIDLVYTEEKRQLNELEVRFKTLETEYLEITKRRGAELERQEEKARLLREMIKAATTIQAFWRSYKVRKALRGKKKKKGKAAGKKGGKKGGTGAGRKSSPPPSKKKGGKRKK